MARHGMVRTAAALPRLRVADVAGNVQHLVDLLLQAAQAQVDVLVFPELCLTGYTCADLFQQTTLQEAALHGLKQLLEQSAQVFPGLAIVGLPLVVDNQLFNVAAALQKGRLLTVVPKSYLPTYKEFYEDRWFAPGLRARNQTLQLLGQAVPFGTDLLLDASADLPGAVIGIEICEDLWTPIPPSSYQALAGATLLVNLSASNEVIGKADYRRALVVNQSARCLAGYVYASCGVHESTTDVVFSGHALIAENGSLLIENDRYGRDNHLLIGDVDVERLVHERCQTSSFGASQPQAQAKTWRKIQCRLERISQPRPLQRPIDPHPYVPRGTSQLAQRCQDIFHMQVAGLAKRLEHIGKPQTTLGVSGGLDSTLALLVACKALDLLKLPRRHLLGLTMPGFGTSQRTLTNARTLMRLLNVSSREIDIRQLCLEEMRLLGHAPFGIDLAGLDVIKLADLLTHLPPERRQDLVFENVQARMRTNLLMNAGFVIGTGDLSELALGWCTYNGDHMSMYNPNFSIPKTLVQFLVRWVAEHEFDGEVRRTLLDVAATQISPELLPAGADGQSIQETEGVIGPYELHDFFLYHFLRFGTPPAKILYLAEQAKFDKAYAPQELHRWLQVFVQRFFANQFKRSCLPDGPKVGTVSLSPRGDWRMPSDAAAQEWLKGLAEDP